MSDVFKELGVSRARPVGRMQGGTPSETERGRVRRASERPDRYCPCGTKIARHNPGDRCYPCQARANALGQGVRTGSDNNQGRSA